MSPLLGLAAAVGGYAFLRWLVRAITIPKRRCWLCKGTGRNWWSTEDRKGDCWLCHNEPWRMTFGARLIRGQVRLRPGRWDR